MLSILIPIYNFDVTKLVTKLAQQCHKANILYEIICFDDKSTEKWRKINSPLNSLFRVNYVELSENKGRSRIRNKLAEVAVFPYLIFLDCDSRVKYAKYIKEYIKAIKDGSTVCYGGRVYGKKKPRAKGKALHWVYGTKREALSAKKRNRKPYLSFQTNNFLIDRELFLSIKFDPTIEGYGYEDLVFANELKMRGIRIDHIHNPIEHIDLHKAKVFLQKTATATSNLLLLIEENKIMPTRLSKFAAHVKKYRLENRFISYFEKNHVSIFENLNSPNPHLHKLDMYKLYLFLCPNPIDITK